MSTLINESFVLFNLEANNRNDVIEAIAQAFNEDGRLKDKNGYIQDILDREAISSTAIGFDFATPHTQSANVNVPSLGFAHLKEPIVWDEKGNTADLVFQIALPDDADPADIEIISNMFRHIIDENFRETVRNAASPQEIIAAI